MRTKRSETEIKQLPISQEEEITFDPWIDFRPDTKQFIFMCVFLAIHIPILLYTIYGLYRRDTKLLFDVIYYSIDSDKVLTLLNRTYLK